MVRALLKASAPESGFKGEKIGDELAFVFISQDGYLTIGDQRIKSNQSDQSDQIGYRDLRTTTVK